MLKQALLLFALCAIYAALSSVQAASPYRFAAEELQQEGRITLTPSFSPDGSTLYFAQSECDRIGDCPQRLKRSRWIDGRWSTPVAVELPKPGRVDWPSVTPDGRYLLFSWSAVREDKAGLDIYEDFDLYRLDLSVAGAVPEPIDSPDINRPRAGAIKKRAFSHNETMPVESADGSLYFWTERADGIGERDIFVAPIGADGQREIARPLAAPLNSTGRDTSGWISPEQDLILLSYPDRGGEGGDDLFLSSRRDGRWLPPVPMGSSVNSPYDEFAPKLSADRRTLLFSSTRPFAGRGEGLIQVWAIPVVSIPALAAALEGTF